MKRIILFLSLMMAFSVPSFARERIPTKKEVDNVDDTEQDGTQVRNFSEIDIDELLPYEKVYSYNLDRNLQEKILEKIEEKTGKNLIFYNGFINDNGGGKRSIYFVELNQSDELKPNGDPLYYYKNGQYQYSDNTFNGQKKQYEVDIKFKGFLYNILEYNTSGNISFNLFNKIENKKIINIFDQYFGKYNTNVTPIDEGNYFLIQYEDGDKYVAKLSTEDFINKLSKEKDYDYNPYYPDSKPTYKNGDTKLKEETVKYINEELVKLCKEPLRLKSDDIVYDDGVTYFVLEDNDGNEYPVNLDIKGYRQELSQKIDLGTIYCGLCLDNNNDFLSKLKIITGNNDKPNNVIIYSENGHFYVNFDQTKNELQHKYKVEVELSMDIKHDVSDNTVPFVHYLNNYQYQNDIFKADTEEKENKDFKFYKFKNIYSDEHGQYVITNNEKTNTTLKIYIKKYDFNNFDNYFSNKDYTIYVDKNENKKEKAVNFAKNLVEVFNNSYLYNVNFTVLPDTFSINEEDATIDLLDSISNKKFKQKITVKEISKYEDRFMDASDSCNSIESQMGRKYHFITKGMEKKEINGKEKTLYYYTYFGQQNEMLKVYANIPHKYQLNGELNIKKDIPLCDFKTKLISDFLKEHLLYVTEIVSFDRNLKEDNDGKYFDIVYKDLDNENQDLKVYIDESKWRVLETLTGTYWLDLPNGKEGKLSDEDVDFVKQFFDEKYIDGANKIDIKRDILTDENGNKYFVISGNDHTHWNDQAFDYNIYLNEREKPQNGFSDKCQTDMFHSRDCKIYIRAMDCYHPNDVLMKYSKKKKEDKPSPSNIPSPSNLPKTTPSNIPKTSTPSTRTSTPPTVTNRTPITIIEPKPNEETKITEQNEIVTNHSPETNGVNRVSRNIKTGDNFWEILFCSLGVANLLYLLFYKRNKIRE